MATTLKKALLTQNILGDKILKLIINGKKTKLEKRTLGFYETKKADLNGLWKQYDANDTEIRQIIAESGEACTDAYILADKYSELEASYSEYMGELRSNLTKPCNDTVINESIPLSQSISPQHTQIQLPRISLPSFNGDYNGWRSFHDLFTSMIHTNSNLVPVQKLQYLKSCLTGEAERLLKHIPVTAEDYEPAWAKLKNRYENKRLLVNTQIKILVNQPKILNENGRALRQLIETTEDCEQQLKSLDVIVSTWDALIIYLLVQKLPFVTLRLWEEELGDSQDLPSLNQFKKFLNTRFRILEAVSQSTTLMKPAVTTTRAYHTVANAKCPACNEAHYVGTCNKFIQMDPKQRRSCIEASRRCFNCFSNSHVANKCISKYRCKKCNNKHHSLLHSEEQNSQERKKISQHKIATNTRKEEGVKTTSFFVAEQQNALLATALVSVYDRNGRFITLRCLIDSGSQLSFITESSCRKLGVIGKSTKVEITGLNTSQAAVSTKEIKVDLHNNKSKLPKVEVTMLVIKRITDMLPSSRTVQGKWEHLKDLNLADPTYYLPGSIDILLGATVFAEILQEGLIKGPKEAPVAMQTTLGWILLGASPKTDHQETHSFTAIRKPNDEICHQLKRFWEIEEISTQAILRPDDQECEEIYAATHKRLDNGQYQVTLPFEEGKNPILGSSRPRAQKRFESLQNKIKGNTALEAEYAKCLDEYLELDHMEKIDQNSNEDNYYIPHHAVFKESTTTKLRVVFDASAKTSNNKSLNEQMLTGPTLQPTLFSTLMKWRKHKVAVTADIEKMYRMILINPEQRKYQRIIWRDPKTKIETDYQLRTVTFGTSAAPYLAIKTLQQLAKDEKENYPLAAQIAMSDFYVDDLLSGADNIEDAKELQVQCTEMLSKGHFRLRKWASNQPEVVENLPLEHRELKGVFQFDEHEILKTLGIRWYPGTDYFTFMVHESTKKEITKRSILSQVASLYDPLGWISPVLIVAKLLIQELWISGCAWDKNVDETTAKKWNEFKESLPTLSKLRIPRWIGYTKNTMDTQIHGFCDASIKAYGAAVYMRVEDATGRITSHLIASKTKVAPIKPVTLPRLELCGAVLLSRLIESTIKSMDLKDCKVTAWTDSMITLQWIKNHPSKWKTFVSHRVAEIQERLEPSNWRHIPTAHNPSDIASRGITTKDIIQNAIWWHGPSWLVKDELEWPKNQVSNTVPTLEAKKTTITLIAQSERLFEQFSSFVKLKRTIALILRFCHNARKGATKQYGTLQKHEVDKATNLILRIVQKEIFTEEVRQLSNNRCIEKKSSLLSLMPFLDEQQVMRVGGRLENANISYGRKHPIILPQGHHVTNLIIQEIHQDTLHGGVNLVLNTSRHLYWILNGKRNIASIINRCVTCIRHRKEKHIQQMGDLPSPRVNIAKPFCHVGMDFAGPIILKMSTHRNSKQYKGYFCVFVCMATKAIHLEVVSDLTSAAFIAAFRRFVSRRGLCTDIYSDCGTNFKGARVILDKEINQALQQSTPVLEQYFSQKGISWHFNPPGAPHFGGLWEAGVKSVKYHLKRVIGKAVYTYEEYTTLLCQVEACLNSRPLTHMDNRTDEMEILTPGHFLLGQAVNTIPEPEIMKITPGQRWRHIQFMTQQFWNKWSREYLNTLQQRAKWQISRENIKIGDIVLLKDENTAPTFWPIGRIERVFPGSDKLVRVVEIQTQHSLLRRPINKICPLVIENNIREHTTNK